MTEAPRILIVEDETALAALVRDYLIEAGMDPSHQTEGTGAAERAMREGFDLVVLDLMLPGVDGLSICRDIRAQSDVPIIMTTAKVEEIDRLLGLELGADDYLCKPFSPRELVARIRAILRRSAPKDATPKAPQRVQLDQTRWRATLDGENLALTPQEFRLLDALVKHPGRVYARDQLLDLAFDGDADVYDRTIDSHIRNIRRKINGIADWNPIRSVYGVGYAFDPDAAQG